MNLKDDLHELEAEWHLRQGARVEMQLRGSTGFPGGPGRCCVDGAQGGSEQGQIMLASLGLQCVISRT